MSAKKTDTLKLEYYIDKSKEKSYIYLPFKMPENVEQINIKYSYKGDSANAVVTGKEKNVVDFGLVDYNGDDVGTRGSDVRAVTVSPTYSTDGYKRVIPKAGTWQIILGAYQIAGKGVMVFIDIEFVYKYHRWLKGDTHMHTTHSDGNLTRQQLAKKAIKKGLDFIIYTDHNNNLECEDLPVIKNLTTIKGIELTTYKGHMNMWGHAKPYDGSFAIQTKEQLLKSNVEAKSRGAVQSINHPLCTLCPWLYDYEDIAFDCIEVWNGPMRKDNLKAVEFWDKLLKEGKKIPMVGGSDYHMDYVITDLFASPTTLVYSASASQDDILHALKNGHSVLTHSPKATVIDMSAEGAKIGDITHYRVGGTVLVSVSKMLKNHTLRIIDAGGEYFTFTAKKKGDYEFRVPVRSSGYVRAEIVYDKKFFARLLHKAVLYFTIREEAYEPVPPFIFAMTNPIYFD